MVLRMMQTVDNPTTYIDCYWLDCTCTPYCTCTNVESPARNHSNPQYSEIAKIDAKEKEVPTAITLFPNPIINGKVNVNFANVLAGKYQLSLSSMDGQIIYSETLQLRTNNLKKTISLGIVAAGNYQLIIRDEKGDSKQISFIVK